MTHARTLSKTTVAVLLSIGSLLCSAADDSLLRHFLNIVGIGAAPTPRGGPPERTGAIWVVAVTGSASVRWAHAGDFRSPVFDAPGAAIYAMRRDTLIRIEAPDASPEIVLNLPGVEKLIGFDQKDSSCCCS